MLKLFTKISLLQDISAFSDNFVPFHIKQQRR